MTSTGRQPDHQFDVNIVQMMSKWCPNDVILIELTRHGRRQVDVIYVSFRKWRIIDVIYVISTILTSSLPILTVFDRKSPKSWCVLDHVHDVSITYHWCVISMSMVFYCELLYPYHMKLGDRRSHHTLKKTKILSESCRSDLGLIITLQMVWRVKCVTD